MNCSAAWTARAAPPPLLDGDVHLWRVLVPAAEHLPPHWPALLTAEEKTAVARKRIPLDARRTLTSRACLRLLLGHYLEVPAASLEFATNAYGKPQLAIPRSAPSLEFNVSHSGDWVVIGVARGLPLGVDVECHRALEFGDLVNSFFSAPERDAWSKLPPAAHAPAFFSAWTRKEAYLKALGLGLSKSLDSFSVSIAPEAAKLIACSSDPRAPQQWLISSLDLAPGYSCAVAVGAAVRLLHTFTFGAPADHPGAAPSP